MNSKIVNKAIDIIREKSVGGNKGYCTLALIGPDGYPTTTTISISKAEGLNWLTFCTGLGAKDERINHCNKASVCLNSEEYHISLVGTIEIITDPEVKKEMWYEGLSNHFTGFDDPAYCVLKFTTERYTLFVDYQTEKGTIGEAKA